MNNKLDLTNLSRKLKNLYLKFQQWCFKFLRFIKENLLILIFLTLYTLFLYYIVPKTNKIFIFVWSNNLFELIFGNLSFDTILLTIAIGGFILEIRQFVKEGRYKFMEKIDNWLIEFQNILNSSKRYSHKTWDTFAVNFINHADKITYFANKEFIDFETVKFFKDQITSAYAIAFRPNCYLEQYYKDKSDINIDNIRENANNVKTFCKTNGWDFGDELLPNDKRKNYQQI